MNTNSWFPGSRSPTLPTRSGAWKGNSDHVNEAVEFGHWWSLMMYTAGSASEQNEVNPARKELPAFFSEEKQPPSVAFLWNNRDSYFFHLQLVVMGLLTFPASSLHLRVRLIIFFSNCCCGAKQGCPKTLKCTIYPFLRIMTQKPRSELTNQDLRIISMTDFKVFEHNTSLVFFSCIYSKRPLKCLKQLKCGWFCVESLYSYHLWPFLIQPQSLPLNFPSITAEWNGCYLQYVPRPY